MRYIRFKSALIVTVVLLLFTPGSPRLQGAEGDEAVIVQCTRPCAAVTAAVVAAGGRVTQEYQNIDALAARVPKSAIPTLVSIAGANAIRKDVAVRQPRPTMSEDVGQISGLDLAPGASVTGAQPTNYNYNLEFTNVKPLHDALKVGQNVVVAVIDSGTVNLPNFFPLSGSVIGGETFVPVAEDTLSATHRENGSHGSMTAEMVAAHAAFVFANTSRRVQALNLYAPGSAIPCTVVVNPPQCGLSPAAAALFSAVPMTGMAPGAKIYAMKVFPASGGGAPESRIIAAMDRAITLRRNYNATGANAVASGTGSETDPFVYSALRIDVVNMSLGGPTLFAGRDIEDQLTLAMLDVGITVVTSAGNDGFAAMTGGSPGTGFGSLTVGAASTSVHERVLLDLQFGTGVGALIRPTTHAQTAFFSSRGPTADGRIDPDIVANGDWSYVYAYVALDAFGAPVDCREPVAVPGTCAPRVLLASGTSFSAPTVAGAAAVLHGAHPANTATQIRNALQKSANPKKLGDDSTPIDQGNGVLDVAAADARLTSGRVSSQVPDLPFDDRDDDEDGLGAGGRSVARNVERAGFRIVDFRGDHYSARVRNLKPGETTQIFVPSDSLTTRLTVTIDQVTPELPPDQQNQVLGGDVVTYVVADAPTSFAVPRADGFLPDAAGDSVKLEIDNPQTGLVRVAIRGDTYNAGKISATVTIKRERRFDGFPTTVSTIEQDEIDFVEVDVPAGARQAVFELAWQQNWARYPTNDLDLVLIDPSGKIDDSGATANSPERVTIDKPAPGRWTAAIVGFTIHDTGHRDRRRDGPQKDAYTFRAEADGRRLKAR
jgi:hypothetical protein